MRPPDMAPSAWERISKLRPDVRDRVLERAAILIFEADIPPGDADERALAEEAGLPTQRSLVGAQ